MSSALMPAKRVVKLARVDLESGVNLKVSCWKLSTGTTLLHLVAKEERCMKIVTEPEGKCALLWILGQYGLLIEDGTESFESTLSLKVPPTTGLSG
eukprot:4423485-Amphidinium_carterae.2